jgi:hypothetical protein
MSMITIQKRIQEETRRLLCLPQRYFNIGPSPRSLPLVLLLFDRRRNHASILRDAWSWFRPQHDLNNIVPRDALRRARIGCIVRDLPTGYPEILNCVDRVVFSNWKLRGYVLPVAIITSLDS